MFEWLFGAKASASATPAPTSSLFSTHVTTPEPARVLDDFFARVFRRTGADFKAVDKDGTPVTAAMDSPNAGNPNALKPFVEPDLTIPFVQLQWYAVQTFVGYQIAAIVAQHWLVDKACTMPARDAIRHGYEITVNDGEKADPALLRKIRKLDKKFGIKRNVVEFVRFNRIFGIRIALFDIESDDPLFYEKPFNIDGVKPGSYKGISQIDPYWITPELDGDAAANPASRHFYEPTWWRVNGRRYHRTHLIVIRNGSVADILKPTYLYGGVSIPQKIAERVYAAERTANEAPMLAMTKRLLTWKMDIQAALSNQEAFDAKMAWFVATRDNFGVKTIGLQDEIEQTDTSLADVDDVIMTQYQLVAAIADVPSTELLGTSPKGFNATGEYESDSYIKGLETIQSNDMEPLIDRHYLLLSKSEGLGVEIEIEWNAADSPSAKDLAEINKTKADTATAYAQAGAIDGTDIRQKLIADKDSGFNGIPDIVPGGPGDRAAEQDRRDQELEASVNPPDKKSDEE